ncbi:MAG: IS21 family transposase [Candidatus Latescibacterota bacterium]
MAVFIHSREELAQHIVIMHTRQGWSIRALSRHFAISRNTVRQILRKHQAERSHGHDLVSPARPRRTSKLDSFADTIQQLLTKYPKITGQRLFEELQPQGYDGGISILRERLRSIRPTPKREPVVRFETEPGIQGQMDWSPYTITFRKTGRQQVQCFSYILAFSRRQFIDFTCRRDFFTLIRRHQDAFAYFEGVPVHCLYDSEKTVVLRWEAGRPLINPAFASFITHYCCRPVICSRGRAETKGKVERPFQYVENNLLCGREFDDLDDLRTCAGWWLQKVSDAHIHDTTGQAPGVLFFEQERQALHPLPLHPYDSAETALRVCDLEGYIAFETNRYPVPYDYVADILTMKATDSEVLIYAPDLALIVRHERLPAGARITGNGAAIHGARSIRCGLEPVRDQFLALGEHAADFLKGLTDRHPRNAGFHARHILHEKERYNCDDINGALGHALRYHAYDCSAVERILRARAQPRTLESIRNERAARQLRSTLPQIRQRPLAEYDHLLHNPTPEGPPHEDHRHRHQDQDPATKSEAGPPGERPR